MSLETLAGLGFVGVAIFVLTAMAVPRWRPRWPGSPVQCGPMTCLGYVGLIAGAAVLLLTSPDAADSSTPGLASPLLSMLWFFGALLAVVGGFLDHRRHGAIASDNS